MRTVLLGFGLVVLIIGIGMANYLTGGFDAGTEAPSVEEIVSLRLPEAPDPAPLALVDEVSVSWDTDDGVALNQDGLSTLEAVFTGADGRIYLVDHPQTVIGARVRWFRDGEMLGSHFAPGGATLFSADENGFLYVIAKGASSSERVVVVDVESSQATTFTIPLEINSGGITRVDGDLYAVAWSGFVDPDTRQLEGQDVLVPVTSDRAQVTDDAATNGVIQLWRNPAEGLPWGRTVVSSTDDAGIERSEQFLVQDSKRIRIPFESYPLDVDRSGRAWILMPPTAVTHREVAGWPSRADDSALLVVIDANGTTLGATPIPVPGGLYAPDTGLLRNIGFDGRYLTCAEMHSDGVRVSVYEVGE